MRQSFSTFLVLFFGGLFLISMLCLSVYFPAKMESDTFNNLTGKHTTWKDAVFLELRVQETIKDSANVRN